MSSVKKEVLSIIYEVQTLLKQDKYTNESVCRAFEQLNTLLADSTEMPTNDTLRNHLQEAKSLFASEYYVSVAECLIESFSPDWLQGGSGGRHLHQLFSDFFVQGDPEGALTVLSHAVSATKESLKLYSYISLLESLLKQNCLRRTLSRYCCPERSDSISEHVPSDKDRMLIEKSGSLVSAISSLPDLVTAKLRSRDDSDFFYPQNYIQFVGQELVNVLRMVYSRLREGQSCSVSVISAILGKLAMTGHGRLLWESMLKELEMTCISDFLWQRVLQRTVSGVPDRCLEQVTIPLIFVASSHLTLKAILGDLPTVRERLSYTLTHKLLLVRYTDRPQILQNVVGYLASTDLLRSTFLTAFKKLLCAWSDGSSLRHRPLEQTIYLCKAIMIFVAYLSHDASLVTADLRDTVMQTLLSGMTNYLDSSVIQIRQMGMVVGESLSSLVHSDEKRLEFEIERNELVDSLRELLITPSYEDRQSAHDHSQAAVNKQLQENDSENSPQNVTERGKGGATGKSTNASETLDSDDEVEEELKPYDLDPKSSKPCRRPMYLGQCLNGLLKSDDPVWFEQCLQHAEEMIRKHPEVSEMAVEMCKVLLNLEDQFSLPEFVLQRHKALVALVVSCPATTVEYLTHEFYERNYNVSQRLDILDVLSSAARELSQPVSSTDRVSGCDTPSSEEHSTKPDETHWSSIVQARIESKTRRFAKGATRPPPVSVPNRFAKVAGWFFYPLMSQFDKRESCVDLLGCDHILLQRLLGTLGVVIYCATNVPNISPMARALIEFTWCFRHHTQPGVRQAVLGAILMMTVAVPPFLLLSDLCSEVTEMREWLQEEVMLRDPDSECRSLSAQILMTLQTKLKKEVQDTNDINAI